MGIISNPDLKWDGNTPLSKEGRPLEAPLNWTLTAVPVEDEPSPYIHHRENGFNIDANHVRAKLVWAQPVTIPAGTHYVIVHNFSHLTWGSDDFTIAWRIELESGDRTIASDDVWVSRTKGDQSFAVKMTVDSPFDGLFKVVFWTKWADSNGSIDLQKIDIQPQDWGVPTRQSMILARIADRIAERRGSVSSDTTEVTPGTPGATDSTTVSTVPDNATLIKNPMQNDNPALGILFSRMAMAMNECAVLTRVNTDPATIAQCYRRLANALNDAADAVEKDA